jgi:quercetin dioxygenase-like cupin family protein
MTVHRLGDHQPISNRPGSRGRDLVGSEHGVSSFYVAELLMEAGASNPLHTHPIEEAFVVAEGALVLRVADETVVAEAESTVRIPPNVPHAVRNAGPGPARALAAAAWNRATFFTEATTYLEGEPR